MKFEFTTPIGGRVSVEETPGGVYGGRLRFTIRYKDEELNTTFEVYMKDFEKLAKCFFGKLNLRKGEPK